MATKKQILARKRNWNKFQLNGDHVFLDRNALTTSEITILQEIEQRINTLKEHWEKNSKVLGIKKGVRYNVFHKGELILKEVSYNETKFLKNDENIKIKRI